MLKPVFDPCIYDLPVLECRRPLVPAPGTIEHLDVRVGGHAVFQCDPGYTLKGFRMATCLLDGSWSTPSPQCGKQQLIIRYKSTSKAEKTTFCT